MEKFSKFAVAALLIIMLVLICWYIFEIIACNPNNLAETKGMLCDKFDNTNIIKYIVDGKEYYYFNTTLSSKHEIGYETTVVYSKVIPCKSRLAIDKVDPKADAMLIVYATSAFAGALMIAVFYIIINGTKTVDKNKRVLTTFCGRKYYVDKNYYYEFEFEEDGEKRLVYSQGDSTYEKILKDSNINKVYCYVDYSNYCKADFEGTLAEKNIVVCFPTKSIKSIHQEDDPIRGD